MGTLLVGILVIFGSGVAAALVSVATLRLVPTRFQLDLRRYGALVTGFIGGLLLVTLVFTTTYAWQTLSNADHDVKIEATSLTELYWYARGLPEPSGTAVKTLLRNYTNEVVSAEWTQMEASDSLNDQPWLTLDKLRYQLDSVRPADAAQTVRYAAAQRQVTALGNARRDRGFALAANVPATLWVILIISAFLMVAAAAVTATRPAMQALLAFISAMSIAFVLFLVAQLDHPFKGSFRVDRAPFDSALQSFSAIDAFHP